MTDTPTPKPKPNGQTRSQKRRERSQKRFRAELEKVYKLQLRACFYCRNFRDLEHLTVDHFIPKSAFYVHMTDGGKLWWHVYRGNVVLACMSCNMVKANRHPTEGAIKMYALLFGRPAPTLESLLAYKQEQRQLFGDKRKAPQQ